MRNLSKTGTNEDVFVDNLISFGENASYSRLWFSLRAKTVLIVHSHLL